MYLDANNLYGWAMSQKLPTGNFEWVDKNINLSDYDVDSSKAIILEVDLEYPKELHDLHNDYPVAPEKIKVSNEMLSNYCKRIAEKFIYLMFAFLRVSLWLSLAQINCCCQSISHQYLISYR